MYTFFYSVFLTIKPELLKLYWCQLRGCLLLIRRDNVNLRTSGAETQTLESYMDVLRITGSK